MIVKLTPISIRVLNKMRSYSYPNADLKLFDK